MVGIEHTVVLSDRECAARLGEWCAYVTLLPNAWNLSMTTVVGSVEGGLEAEDVGMGCEYCGRCGRTEGGTMKFEGARDSAKHVLARTLNAIQNTFPLPEASSFPVC